MLDLLPSDTTEARKSKELTESDLGMPPQPVSVSGFFKLWLVACVLFVCRGLGRLATVFTLLQEEKSPREGKLRPTLADITLSESGYGSSSDDLLDSSRSTRSSKAESVVHTRVTNLPPPPPLPKANQLVSVDDDGLTTLLGAVRRTRIVTAVFEVAGAGLNVLQADFDAELAHWFGMEGSQGLIVAAELVWSVPAKARKPAAEVAIKQALFAALRRNNKRVLDLRWPKRRLSKPICFPEAGTEELSGRDRGLNAYQGTYRRHYDDLLPLQHQPTGPVHAEYWAWEPNNLRPAPHRFLFGPRRDVSELATTCLLALNATAIAFR